MGRVNFGATSWRKAAKVAKWAETIQTVNRCLQPLNDYIAATLDL
jgi:hypothetical protein